MDTSHGRGRSSSRSNVHHISPVPSPHHYHDAVSGLDPALNQPAFTTGSFNTTQQQHYTTPFLESTAPQSTTHGSVPDTSFYPNNQFNQHAFQDNHFQGQTLDPSYVNNDYMYQSRDLQNDYSGGYVLNTSFDHMNQNANINPADLSKISSPQDHTSPNLLSPDHHSSPGQPASPASTNGQYYTPQHSRHQSLDPAAAYGQADWQNVSFQQHRRAPSDQSDVSSNAPSPYLHQQELLQSIESHHSPYLASQPDAANTFGIDNFNLNEHSGMSPGHTPYISPRLLPSQNQGLGLSQDMMLAQGHMGAPGPEIFTTQPETSFSRGAPTHARNQSTVSELGQADQFAPPTINIEPAPVSRQASFGPDGQNLGNTLSPPNNRSRGRSKSDVSFSRGPLSRSVSPAGRSPPTHHASDSLSVRSHSPGPSMSRESSPVPGSGRPDKNRRASTSSINSREYILDLADPGRPNASPSHSSTRVQKHPATFQCNLCPKRFTRAYNLRSHLRTHTDERPFVCTVCGKAFARQHDRKRHEGLHSGEKKFVCKGELHSSPGQYWGCGRRFARADALGRHFRSEAGRVCIKPLLDEEAVERRNKMFVEQQHQAQYTQGGLQPVAQPMMIGMDPATGAGGFTLPAALLAQYPALQNIDWSQIQQGDDPGEMSDVGMGRSSFDGSSGGEYYDDGDGNEAYVSGQGMQYNSGGQQDW